MMNASITSNSSTAQTVVDSTARHMATATVVIYSVIFLTGTVGNGLVIYVTGCRMKKTVNSVWFLNLALADFLFTAFLLFLAIKVSKGYWPFGGFMCKLNSFVGVVNMFSSVFLLTAISLDRCLSIWVVVWAHNKRTVRKAQILTAVIWMAAIICSTPYATFRVTKEVIPGKFQCVYADETPLTTLTIFRFVVGFFIPFLVICVSYGAINVRARRLQRTRNRRSRRIIFCVVLAFFICWLPFHVIQLVSLHDIVKKPDVSQIVRMVGPISVFMASMNSSLNPILYVFMCDEFQKKFKQSICHVLESALAEDHLSFMSSRSLSSHLSRISRKSESSTPTDRKDTATSLNFTECKVVVDEWEI